MRDQTYDKVMNACVLVAVLSALSFEKAGHLGWLAGLAGLIAGITAIGVYFYHHWHQTPEEKVCTELVAESSEETYIDASTLAKDSLLNQPPDQGPDYEGRTLTVPYDLVNYSIPGGPEGLVLRLKDSINESRMAFEQQYEYIRLPHAQGSILVAPLALERQEDELSYWSFVRTLTSELSSLKFEEESRYQALTTYLRALDAKIARLLADQEKKGVSEGDPTLELVELGSGKPN